MQRWDQGELSLTSERCVWEGRRGTLVFRLANVHAVYAEKHRFVCLQYGMRIYKWRFTQESNLKWLTYIALISEKIEQRDQHRISFSNY
jgi:hypothetical protein